MTDTTPPDQQTPDQQTPDQQTPDQQIPDQQTPDQQIPDQQTPDQQTATDLIRLDGAQRRIRDAFVDADSGLFVHMSDPGAGKSTTTEFIAAEFLLRAANTGVDAPEEQLAFVSFTRDDAASIAPGIQQALQTLARDPQTDLDVSPAQAQALGRRVHQASNIGTVDSVLASLFRQIAPEVGFSDSPTVGDHADLRSVRAACLTRLRDSPRYAAHLDRLTHAYPGDDEYRADAGDLLREAHRACRERRLSVPDFRHHLQTILTETYPTGPPTSFADIQTAIEQFVDEQTALQYEQQCTTQEKTAIVASDRDLHEAWQTAIHDLCTLLEAYIDIYDQVTQERAVVSHLDAAHWVATFFTQDAYQSRFRSRLQQRYAERLSVAIVDEAQDVATVQHAALAPLIPEDTRVLLAGDLKQLIFLWRNAHPALFRAAIDDGRYFGSDWDTHVVEYEHRTRRCRPDIAGAIDTVFADVFTDPARGADDSVTETYSALEPTRPQVPHPNVHIAAVSTDAPPGSSTYVSPPQDTGEADALAACLADGLATGRFTHDSDPETETETETDPSVTVLFHRRTHLDAYTRACERAGLSVGNATANLFAHPLVKIVVEVCTALSQPDVGRELRCLLRGSDSAAVFSETVLSETRIPDVVDLYGPSLSSIVAQTDGDRAPVAFIHGLETLATEIPPLTTESLGTVVETVLTELDLWTDPLDLTDNPTRRVAALDALLNYVDQLEDESHPSIAGALTTLKHLCATPKHGPYLPLTDEEDYDVVFKTIFQMKGDEADVVALGDIGHHIGQLGPHVETVSAQGSRLAVAPPASETTADTPALPGFEHGIYTRDCAPWEYDAGLRWITQRWADEDHLAGAPPLARLAHTHRAGRWRLLYVALTRARNHLVVPLPERRTQPAPRDYWIDTLRDALAFDHTVPDTYACETPAGESLPIHVSRAPADTQPETASNSLRPSLTDGDAGQPPSWTPRYVNPSTLGPLVEEPEKHVLDHLQSRSLETHHGGISDELGLTLETVSPEEIGEISHEVLATAIRHRETVERTSLRECRGMLRRTLESELAGRPSISREERQQLHTFMSETLCPQVAQSDVWAQIQTADEVYVEEPVHMIRRIDGLETELKGTPDVVIQHAPDHWEAAELKIIFQDTETVRSRYRLQAQVYAWALSTQLSDETVIRPRLVELGATLQEEILPWDEERLRARLSQIRSLL